MRHFFLFVFLILLIGLAGAAALQRGIAPAIQYENQPKLEEIYRIRLENKAGGAISVSKNEGASWEAVGKVIYPTDQVSEQGYAAAKYIEPGLVAATAVNAIHLKTGAVGWQRTIFSILPHEFLAPPKKYKSYLSPDASIYTNISAGTSIFGGGYAPFVGNQVLVSQPAKPVVPVPRDYVPKIGDVLFIIVKQPVNYPKEIVFENRFGGKITIKYFSGEEKVIGEVLRPVVGIGRFEGSLYALPGRIRANHAGVIDVTTSPLGAIGGFQIVPALHGEDMGYVREQTQWMVIGPADVDEQSLEGLAPFYKYFLQPSYEKEDLLSRFLVEAKYVGDEKWRPLPILEINQFYLRRNLPDWAESALRGVSHIRILFPVD